MNVGSMTDDELIRMWNKANERDARGKRNAKKAAVSEHSLQVHCVNWFRCTYPEYGELLIAIPNGGKRNVIVASKLKAEGVVAGVPDLFLAIPNGTYHGLFIEMKNGKSNNVTDNQRRVMFKLSCNMYKTIVVRTSDEFEKIIQEYLHPLKKSSTFAPESD